MSKPSPGPYEVESKRADCGQPPYFAIIAPAPEGISGPYIIADTLNCHHCIDPDEARANAELLAQSFSLARWKEEAMIVLAKWDKVYVELGGASLGEFISEASLREVKRIKASNAEILEALAPIKTAIEDKEDVRHDSWNPEAHVELTLTIAECRAVLAAIEKAKRPCDS